MAERFLETYLTPAVLAAQRAAYGRTLVVQGSPARDPLGPDEAGFVAARDSFYLASVNADGWPYVQHRGGPPGFLTVLDPHTLAFADLRGNRQLITAGNLAGDDRVALFLMDYPARTRLKLNGRARLIEAAAEPALAARLAPPGPATGPRRHVERLVVIDVLSFDWNCPAWITPRYTTAEVEEVVGPLRARVAELERLLAERGGAPDARRQGP